VVKNSINPDFYHVDSNVALRMLMLSWVSSMLSLGYNRKPIYSGDPHVNVASSFLHVLFDALRSI